jgi:hypothetical protein
MKGREVTGQRERLQKKKKLKREENCNEGRGNKSPSILKIQFFALYRQR